MTTSAERERRLSARARATALGVVVLVAAVLIGLLVGPVRIGAANEAAK